MNLARTYRCTRMRRWVERSNDTEPLPLRPFCRGCIIATRGYDFREGQGVNGARSAGQNDRNANIAAVAGGIERNRIITAPHPKINARLTELQVAQNYSIQKRR